MSGPSTRINDPHYVQLRGIGNLSAEKQNEGFSQQTVRARLLGVEVDMASQDCLYDFCGVSRSHVQRVSCLLVMVCQGFGWKAEGEGGSVGVTGWFGMSPRPSPRTVEPSGYHLILD